MDEDLEIAIDVIIDYLDFYLGILPGERHNPRKSYRRWAVITILDRMMKETMKNPEYLDGEERESPIDIICEFIYDMEYLCEEATHAEGMLIFMEAQEEGMRILDLFENSGVVSLQD